MIDGPSLYAYVGNNPLGFADLFGLYKWKCKKSFSDSWCRLTLGVPERDGCQKLCCRKIKPDCRDSAENTYRSAVEACEEGKLSDLGGCKKEALENYRDQMLDCGVPNPKEPQDDTQKD